MDHLYKPFVVLGTKWRRDLLFRTRIQVTALYVGTASLVLCVFSYVLYGVLSTSLKEVYEDQFLGSAINTQAVIDRAQDVLLSKIIFADMFALVLICICGYFLTGLTLRPLARARERERRFLADAAHELRTPLSVMKSGNEVVLTGETPLSPRIERLLNENIQDIDSLTKIANELLALVSTKKVTVDTVPCTDVRSVLGSVVHRLTPRAEEKKLQLSLNVQEIPHVLLVALSKESLGRIFENVIENAIKYTATGSIHVVLAHTPKQILVTATDTGIGIAASDVARVTEPFFRADSARTSYEGTGLGLSIVSELLDAHGGSLKISSTVGVGTVVGITLAHTA
jgi:two-component system, OmpR family, sensor histidine kinase CiaH